MTIFRLLKRKKILIFTVEKFMRFFFFLIDPKVASKSHFQITEMSASGSGILIKTLIKPENYKYI